MLRNVFQRVRQRVWVGGIVGGLLLMVVYLVVPERFQAVTTLYLGMAALLGCTVGLLASARDARLEWRGLSPAIAVLAGAIPLILTGIWTHREVRRETTVLRRPPAVRPAAAVIATAPPRETKPESQDLERLMGEVSRVINEKARPAMVHLSLMARAPAATLASSPGHRMQLQSATQDLSEVQSSLALIKAQNGDIRSQLDLITGDTANLAELISGLRDFDQLLESIQGQPGAQVSAALSPALLKLRQLQAGTMQWIVDCNQRLNDQRAGRLAGNPGDGAR